MTALAEAPTPPARGTPEGLWLDMVETTLAPEVRDVAYRSPGAMAAALDRTTVQTPALEAIDDKLVEVAEGRCERLGLSMPPQEGKSQRASRWFPLWLLARNPNLRIAIVSYGHDIARRWGRAIRDDLRRHPELGLTLSQSTQRQDEFELLGYAGGVVCTGIGGSLTGRAVDVLIIDDPYKDAKQADSKAWKEQVEEFWREVALPRLAPKAPVVIIQTRWREDDLLGWLGKEHAEEWEFLNLPAQADHNPAKGESDPLGREPGEYLTSARGRTAADWQKKAREIGARAWQALYQGKPSPPEGSIFKRSWWREYAQPLWIERSDGTFVVTGFDDMLASWDMSFKDTDGTDYVVGAIWARRGADAYLLDLVRARMDFPTTRKAVRLLAAKWPQALAKLVEDKANGTAVIASLAHVVPGIIAVEPEGGKEARAAAVSPLVESGNCYLPSPEIAPWVGAFIDEHAAFPTGTHDDQVDTTSQALNRLILQPLLAGEDLMTEDDFDDELAEFAIAPYAS